MRLPAECHVKERLPSAAGLQREMARVAGQLEAAPPWGGSRAHLPSAAWE